MTRAEFIGAVAMLCEMHGGSVTSWIRTKKHNSKVGGKVNSRHLTGFGCDVILDADEDGIASNDAAVIASFKDACQAFALVGINEGDHIHVQPEGPWGRATV
jgi:hypothetical protein